MKLYLVWNVNRARPFNKRPLSSNRAGRLADLLETRHDEPYVLTMVRGRAASS